MIERNVAVVGAGYWGKNLIRNFAGLGALHTICDTSARVLQSFESLYQDVSRETDFGSVLGNNEVKAVVISTPVALHFSMAKQALLANKDVFVEKPLSLLTEEGEELVRLAGDRNRILMVGHLLEYHPAVIRLKELVGSGELGKMQYIYSNRLNLGKFRTEENILWSFAPHDISVILWLLNEMPQHVSAHGGYYLHRDIADVTTSVMHFGSGVLAHIFVSWLHPYKEQRLVIVGDKAMAVFDDMAPEGKLRLYKHEIDWIDRMPVPHQQKGIAIAVDMVEPLKVECQHFLDCLVSRQIPRTDGVSALRVLRVLEACQRSLQAEGAAMPLGEEQDFFVHETSLIERPGEIGTGTKIWHFCHVMPNVKIGKHCTLGQNVFVGGNVSIGNNVKIENNVSVFDGVVLEDDAFCGPACVFTNVKKPRGHISQKGKFIRTLVKKGATVGANATVICGNTLGRYSLVGAGSVVTSDIPDFALVYGNPARIRGWVCKCGAELHFGRNSEIRCHECGQGYRQLEKERVIELDTDKC